MNEELVTFEQAEMLAKTFGYRGKSKHCYITDSKELLESNEPMNHNLARSWAGVDGWHYARYTAPTKDEAINYLIEIGLVYDGIINQLENHEKS